MRGKLIALLLLAAGLARAQYTPPGGTGGGGGGGAVASVSGTSGQINVSPNVGAVVVSLTNGLGAVPCTITAAASVTCTHNFGLTGTNGPLWVTGYSSGNILGGSGSSVSLVNVVQVDGNNATVTFSNAWTGTFYLSTGSMGPVGNTGAPGTTGPAGGGATIASTTSALKGNGSGNGVAVTGASTNCVHVDGTSGVCASGGYGPTTTRPGSPVFANMGATANTGRAPGGTATVCGAAFFWPTAGWFRNAGVTTTGVQASNAVSRTNFDVDCLGSALMPGGAVVPPGAAAGGFVDATTLPYGHIEQGGVLGIYLTKGSFSGTLPTHNIFSGEFISDDNLTDTVFAGSSNAAAPAASTTTYFAIHAGYSNTTELKAAIPMPVAGTFTGVGLCTGIAAPTNTATWTLNKNGVATALLTTLLSTDAIAGCKNDFADGPVTVAAGDYLDFAYATGATTVAGISNYFETFVPTNGTSSVWSAIWGNTVNATLYDGPGFAANASATEQAITTAMPYACSATNLYAVLATLSTGTHVLTLTLRKNLVSTAITGTVTPASGTGSIAIYTGAPVAFAKGDQVDLMATVAGSPITSGIIGGWSFSCN